TGPGARPPPLGRCSLAAHLIHDADDAATDRQLSGGRDPEQLPDAGTLAQDENGVALARAAHAIDGDEAVAGCVSRLVHGLDDEQLVAGKPFGDDARHHRADDASEVQAASASPSSP